MVLIEDGRCYTEVGDRGSVVPGTAPMTPDTAPMTPDTAPYSIWYQPVVMNCYVLWRLQVFWSHEAKHVINQAVFFHRFVSCQRQKDICCNLESLKIVVSYIFTVLIHLYFRVN